MKHQKLVQNSEKYTSGVTSVICGVVIELIAQKVFTHNVPVLPQCYLMTPTVFVKNIYWFKYGLIVLKEKKSVREYVLTKKVHERIFYKLVI